MEKAIPPDDLIDKLGQALIRDQDRTLFGLLPKSPAAAGRTLPQASAPIHAWRPGRLADGSWASLFAGRNPKALPLELAGLTVTVRTRSSKSWHATTTEVVERSPERTPVRTRRLNL